MKIHCLAKYQASTAVLQKDIVKDLNNYGLSSRSRLQLTR